MRVGLREGEALLTKCRLLIAAAATVVSFNANAQTFSGNEWLTDCSLKVRSRCPWYAIGLAEGFILWAQSPSSADAPTCIPEGVKGVQIVDVGVRYMKAHPEILQQPADILLRDAFKEAWPCSHK